MMRDFFMSVIPLKGASIRGNDALPEINPALEVLSKYLKLYKSNGGKGFTFTIHSRKITQAR